MEHTSYTWAPQVETAFCLVNPSLYFAETSPCPKKVEKSFQGIEEDKSTRKSHSNEKYLKHVF